MAKIKFENGVTVNFNGDPTPDDIEEVASQFSNTAPATAATAPPPQGIRPIPSSMPGAPPVNLPDLAGQYIEQQNKLRAKPLDQNEIDKGRPDIKTRIGMQIANMPAEMLRSTVEGIANLPAWKENIFTAEGRENIGKLVEANKQAAAQTIPNPFTPPPAKGTGEGLADIGTGLGKFMAQLLIAKKIVPQGTVINDYAAWELANRLGEGEAGHGLLMRGIIGGANKFAPQGTKTLTESAGFVGLTAADPQATGQDALISGLIPIVMRAPNALKYLRSGNHSAAIAEIRQVDTAGELAKIPDNEVLRIVDTYISNPESMPMQTRRVIITPPATQPMDTRLLNEAQTQIVPSTRIRPDEANLNPNRQTSSAIVTPPAQGRQGMRQLPPPEPPVPSEITPVDTSTPESYLEFQGQGRPQPKRYPADQQGYYPSEGGMIDIYDGLVAAGVPKNIAKIKAIEISQETTKTPTMPQNDLPPADAQPTADTPIESRAGQELMPANQEQTPQVGNPSAGQGAESTTAPDLNRITEYEKKNPDVISADEAKSIIPAYDVSKGKELEFQQEAGDIAKAAYDRYLQSKKGQGNNTILFTAGGTGSGKSTFLKGAKGHTFAVDGTFAYKPHAIEQIDKALENGYNIDVRYVYRDPIEAWKGIWNRYLEGGHFVPADVFYSTHVEAARNV
ncbi:MAG: zeta toxin family protein, partial [Sedimentisphaerales bacterium]|nr:zeta toxin family protein [Sedimentisphaerales bacterium]